MSYNWPQDIETMHAHFGVHDVVDKMDRKTLLKLLEFRFNFLEEELKEGRKSIEECNPEEVVDSLIDLCVVAIGTLDLFRVNPYTAWNRVFKANMAKEVGIKPERPNPLGFPDLIKPEGWVAPNHKGNVGSLEVIRVRIA